MMTCYNRLIYFQKIGTRGLAAVLVSDNIERLVSVGLKGKMNQVILEYIKSVHKSVQDLSSRPFIYRNGL